MSWNLLGIVAWVVLILLLVFVIQNIRKRRLKMIVVDHKRFSAKELVIDFVEVVVWLALAFFMVQTTFFDNPNLSNKQLISSTTEYRPLVLSVTNDKSYYVSVKTTNTKMAHTTYIAYSEGRKITMQGKNASVSYDVKEPITLPASGYPYDKAELLKMDAKYQSAYLAVYEAKYNNNWRNGLGLNANKVANKYYLIRVPDESFIKTADK